VPLIRRSVEYLSVPVSVATLLRKVLRKHPLNEPPHDARIIRRDEEGSRAMS
jgi:hypothetical protein